MFIHIAKKVVDKIVIEIGGEPAYPFEVEERSDLNYALSDWSQRIRQLVDCGKIYSVEEMAEVIRQAVRETATPNVIVRIVPIL